MKRFYATSTPGNDGNAKFLRDTIAEATACAEENVRTSGNVYYVVQIIRRVEKAVQPIKISRIK